MAPALQTPIFLPFPSSTQNFVSSFSTPQPPELQFTLSYRTPPPDLNMYAPRDPTDDDDDDRDD